MYEIAVEILKILETSGYESYIVGGYPRNKYIGIDSDDIDICTSAKPEQIINLFDVIKDNRTYGSMTVLKDGYNYEITTFRKDYYEDSRYPKIEFISSIKDDLNRRDFVINTLLINSKGEYVDLLGAKKDIQSKIIRSVGNPDIKLKEDPIRILRAIRFSINLDFILESNLKSSIKNNIYLLKTITNQRFKIEWNKISNKNHVLVKELDLIN